MKDTCKIILALVLAASLSPTAGHAHGPEHGSEDAAHAIPQPGSSGTSPWAYESVPKWGSSQLAEFPGPTHGGIAISNDGLIYASTDNEKGILVFQPDGTLLKTIAPECQGSHELVWREENGKGFLYASHLLGNRVVKLTTEGVIVWEITAPLESGLYDAPSAPPIPPPANTLCPYTGQPVDPAFSITVKGVKVCFSDAQGLAEFKAHPKKQAAVIAKLGLKAPPARRLFKPTSVGLAPDGSLFVADGYGASVIHRFSPERKYLGTIKEAGGIKFKTPHGVLVDTRTPTPTLLVCDRANNRIVRLALDGTYLSELAKDLPLPSSLSVYGDVTAVAQLKGRVDILDATGKIISTLGENTNKEQGGKFIVPPEAWTQGIFTAPHGICFDRAGNLYVSDWNKWGRLTRLNRMAPANP